MPGGVAGAQPRAAPYVDQAHGHTKGLRCKPCIASRDSSRSSVASIG